MPGVATLKTKMLSKIKVRQCAHIKRVRRLARRLDVSFVTAFGVDLAFACRICQVQCASHLGKSFDTDTIKIP